MPLTKSKVDELNAEIAYSEFRFKRGDISYEDYMDERAQLIGQYYMKFYDEDMQLLSNLDYERDEEPPGFLGMILRVIKKIF